MVAVRAERQTSFDIKPIALLGVVTAVLLVLTVLAKEGALHWGETVEPKSDDVPVATKPIPGWAEKDGADNDPTKCSHPGYRAGHRQCGWCGAELH